MSFAIKRGWGPALVAGVLAVVVLVPADPVTEILTLILVLVLTVIALVPHCSSSMICESNEWPVLDAAMTLSLHIEASWRRASEAKRWA